MNRKFLVFLLLPLMLLATVFPIPNMIPKAHAATPGIVCIAETTATKCPPTPPVFNGPVTTPATQLRVAVFINSSAALNGFDITLKANRTILKPHDAELTGSVLPPSTSTVLSKCIGGVLKGGSTCQSTDTADTITLAVVGPGGFLTTAPTTGLLFTAVYNITGTTNPGGTTVGFQTGCPRSPSSASPNCVAISDGSITPVPETVQTGGFDNSTPPPYVTISASPTSIGPIRPNAPGTSTITLTANNGFADFVQLSSVQSSTALSASFNPPVVDLSTTTSGTSSLTVTASSASNYSITVLAAYTVTNQITLVVSTLSATITLKVQVANFLMTLNPTSIPTADPGTSVTSTVTISPVGTFTGTVTLSTPQMSTGVTATVIPASITGASGTATLTVNLASTLGTGTYNVTVRGSATAQTTNFVFRVTVNVVHDVAINSFTVNPTQAQAGAQVTFTVIVRNKGTVAETVTVNALANGQTVASQNVTIAAGANKTVTLTWNTAGYAAATYQLGAQVMQVSGETSTTDNTVTSGTFPLSAAPPAGLDPTLLAIIGLVAAILIITLVLVLRRRKPAQQPT